MAQVGTMLGYGFCSFGMAQVGVMLGLEFTVLAEWVLLRWHGTGWNHVGVWVLLPWHGTGWVMLGLEFTVLAEWVLLRWHGTEWNHFGVRVYSTSRMGSTPMPWPWMGPCCGYSLVYKPNTCFSHALAQDGAMLRLEFMVLSERVVHHRMLHKLLGDVFQLIVESVSG